MIYKVIVKKEKRNVIFAIIRELNIALEIIKYWKKKGFTAELLGGKPKRRQ